MPTFAHALKKFPVVIVPPMRLEVRIAQYWLNVRVPSIDGALYRVLW
jgi:hypothetical protein